MRRVICALILCALMRRVICALILCALRRRVLCALIVFYLCIETQSDSASAAAFNRSASPSTVTVSIPYVAYQ